MAQQKEARERMKSHCEVGNFIVLEIGAGQVVASLTNDADRHGKDGCGLIRVNPEPRSTEALAALLSELPCPDL